MAKPIRRDALIHTVVYHEPTERDYWGNVTSKEPQTIERVRVEPSKKIEFDGAGDKIVNPSILFWDAVHSTPTEWRIDGKVEFQGETLTIKTVKAFYDLATLHHLEIVVI